MCDMLTGDMFFIKERCCFCDRWLEAGEVLMFLCDCVSSLSKTNYKSCEGWCQYHFSDSVSGVSSSYHDDFERFMNSGRIIML